MMIQHEGMELSAAATSEVVLCTIDESHGPAVARILSAAGIDCRLVAEGEGFVVLVDEAELAIADLVLAKRKKDVEDEDEMDDEEDEEDDDLGEDEDDEFDDDEEDEDEFEEEFEDDELDDDDDDIFYDDDDDE